MRVIPLHLTKLIHRHYGVHVEEAMSRNRHRHIMDAIRALTAILCGEEGWTHQQVADTIRRNRCTITHHWHAHLRMLEMNSSYRHKWAVVKEDYLKTTGCSLKGDRQASNTALAPAALSHPEPEQPAA